MSLTIDLGPREEARLSIVADNHGLAPAEFVKRLVEEHLLSPTDMAGKDVHAKLAKWQQEDGTQLHPDIPTQALFARWAEEDARMTDQEREAEDRLWQDVEQGINATRDQLGMRRL